MEKFKIIQKCETFVKEHIPESRIKNSYLNHVSGCRKYALKLTKIYGANEFIIEVSALLHDIGADAGKTHPKKGAKIAEEFLLKFNIPKNTLNKIIKCIENHAMGTEVNDLEEQIIQDADGIIFLEDTYKYFEKKMLKKTGSLEQAKKLTMNKINGMTRKIKTKEGIKIAKKLLPNTIKYMEEVK